jgi:hypothetical protein
MCSPSSNQHTRTFLRFLRWSDRNSRDLARFVPRTPCWRLAHLPPRLPWEEVRRVIDAIDVRMPSGVRADSNEVARAIRDDVDRDLVVAFLDALERQRKNAIQMRNARLTTIRSFFHHVAAPLPPPLGVAPSG